MEWLSEDPNRGETVLTCIAIVITVTLIWLGRKKLLVTIPCAFTFLLLAAIAIPSFLPARNVAYRNTCINNLKALERAKDEWAREKHKLPADIPMEQDLYGLNRTNGFLRSKLVCPRGGKYTFGAVSEKPTCSLANKGHKLE